MIPQDTRPALSERDLQKQVRNMLEQFGWTVAVTWNSLHSPKGWPDIFAVRRRVGGSFVTIDNDPDAILTVNLSDRGIFDLSEAVAIELKAEKGKVSPEQEMWLDLLRRLPGVKFAGVIRPSQWFAGELDDVLR